MRIFSEYVSVFVSMSLCSEGIAYVASKMAHRNGVPKRSALMASRQRSVRAALLQLLRPARSRTIWPPNSVLPCWHKPTGHLLRSYWKLVSKRRISNDVRHRVHYVTDSLVFIPSHRFDRIAKAKSNECCWRKWERRRSNWAWMARCLWSVSRRTRWLRRSAICWRKCGRTAWPTNKANRRCGFTCNRTWIHTKPIANRNAAGRATVHQVTSTHVAHSRAHP